MAVALGDQGAAVVQAPPGTGKTTLVPPAVVRHLVGRGAGGPGRPDPGGRVVVVQPRRVAARAAARRLTALAGGDGAASALVGFTVRGERTVTGRTVVEFCTPGVLLRRLLADPGLEGTAAVVLDEVHERSLETDLLLGLLADVRQLREDLVLVAMSATLDAPRFAEILTAPVVDCPSPLHELQVRWAPRPGPREGPEFWEHVAAVTAAHHARGGDGAGDAEGYDTLVFLPGVREVDRVAALLRDRVAGCEVLVLHGRLDPRAQDRVTAGRRPGDPRRIVVSTALAESSLTVPGVRLVVDAGLAREPRRDAGRGMSGLVTVACSQDAAVQRAGRAARQGPGAVVRLYDEATWAAMPAHPTPEIAVADLVGAALTLACWGTPRGDGIALPTPPPAAALDDAERLLHGLGAVDGEGRATPLGRRLAGIPAEPRWARALLDGAELVGARAAAEVVAALADDHRPEGADLAGLLRRLRSGRAPGAQRWREEVRRLTRIAGRGTSGEAADDPSTGEVGARSGPGLVVALAHPDRIARRVTSGGPGTPAGGTGATYLLASGTRAALPPGAGALGGQEWLAVADVARAVGRVAAGTGAVIRAAAPLSPEEAELAGAGLLVDEVRARFADGRVTARRVRALGAIELSSAPVRPTPEAARRAVTDELDRRGLSLLSWSPAAAALRHRMALLHAHLGEPWPDVSDTALARDWARWLGPEVDALAEGGRADRIDLLEPLRRLLPWPEAARLDELVPERLEVPSGRAVRVDYDGDRPVVAVKLQECFGLARSPEVLGTPVQFHLLSPAGRPLAVTDDLASFWSGPYAQVRAEMRGRYPKHPWPEDPWSAPATARTRRRST